LCDSVDQFICAMKTRLVTMVEPDTARDIIEVMVYELNGYDLTKSTTEIVPCYNDNEQIIKSYLACLIVEGRTKSTAYQYKRTAMKMFDFLGGKKYDMVTSRDIMVWLASLKLSGVKSVTIKNQRSNICAFFSWLHSNGFIDKNPCEPIKPIKVPYEEKQEFTSDEIDTIRSNCEDDYERALIEFMYASGMRIEEISNVRLEDVDFKSMIVKVRGGKGSKDRTTFITPVARKYLIQYLKNEKHRSEYLFTSKYNTNYTPGGLRVTTRKLSAKCGFLIHPHRFRRTLASDLARKGMPIQEIQKLLGHSNISTTRDYVNVHTSAVEASYRQYAS